MQSILLLVITILNVAGALQLGRTAQPLLQHRPLSSFRSSTTMQSEPPKEEETEATMSAAPSEKDGYTTFYDDEKEDTVLAAKPQISNEMRQRLINEQRGLGADPNSKNPLLGVIGAVGVFVVLGALAVNM
jgi:hypothetical protein